MKAPKKKAPDWERIETLYRTGTRSVREIAIAHGVSHTAINKRAKELCWVRDLSAKVKAAADAKVSRALVSKEVSAEAKLTERVTVEVEATVQAHIRLKHREDIARGRKLAMSLLAELEHQTEHQDLYYQLVDLVLPLEDEGSDAAKERARKLREAYQRSLSLAGRTDTLKKLAETLRILIDKEREAFGIGTGQEGEGGQGAADALRSLFLNQLHAGAGRLTVVREPAQPQKGPLG